jgi:CheY-like chemotaxis protein
MQRILIIDDEETSLDILRQILEIEGYDVVEAKNGQEGIERFRKQLFDLVITDLVMPVKDGLKTILELRQTDPDIPVIAISGGGVIDKERYLSVAGYIDRVTTLPKPFNRLELVAAVHRLIRPVSPSNSLPA